MTASTAGSRATWDRRGVSTKGTWLALAAPKILIGELTGEPAVWIIGGKATTIAWLSRLLKTLCLKLVRVHRLLCSWGLVSVRGWEVPTTLCVSSSSGTLNLGVHVVVMSLRTLTRREHGLWECRGSGGIYPTVLRLIGAVGIKSCPCVSLHPSDVQVETVRVHRRNEGYRSLGYRSLRYKSLRCRFSPACSTPNDEGSLPSRQQKDFLLPLVRSTEVSKLRMSYNRRLTRW
jgi:hypothetical protein